MADVDTHLNPIDAANLLDGQAVAEAEALLAERRDAGSCEAAAYRLQLELIAKENDVASNVILNPVRLLTVALGRAARADTEERRARWRRVLAALTDLVRHESLALRSSNKGEP